MFCILITDIIFIFVRLCYANLQAVVKWSVKYSSQSCQQSAIWPIRSWYQILVSWIGGINRMSTGSLASLSSPDRCLLAPLVLDHTRLGRTKTQPGACSQARCLVENVENLNWKFFMPSTLCHVVFVGRTLAVLVQNFHSQKSFFALNCFKIFQHSVSKASVHLELLRNANICNKNFTSSNDFARGSYKPEIRKCLLRKLNVFESFSR